MPLDMSKYLALFVEEAGEHLEAMGSELVALEKDGDASVLDSCFRHAHSVKGMAASMGFEPIAELAHKVEDLMSLAREGKATLGAAEIDLILLVVDGMNALTQAAGAGKPMEEAGVDTGALGRRLAAALAQAGGAGAAAGADGGGEAAPGPASASGRPTLRVVVQVVGTSKVPGVRGFLVHKRLGGLGEILRSDPSLPDLKAGRLPDHRLEVLLATETAVEAVEQALSTIAELESVKVDEVALREETGARPDRRAPDTRVRAETMRTVRVRTDLLDAFMDSVGELLLVTERIRGLTERGEDEAPGPLDDAVDRLSAIVKDINGQVMATRMIRLATLTDRLPRVVREMARSVGKQVSLVVEGADIELDRAILDEIDPPLTHLLRNCIDHGLESEDERIEAGKPVEGRLRIDARRDRDRVVIEISDDGRGLDTARLRERAVAAGRLTERGAKALSEAEALMLACLPGLSTKEDVSDLSGRGVGMDVVKGTVESLGGTLEIESEKGRGARFILRLPFTVAIQRLLLVSVADEVFGLPVNKVVHVAELDSGKRSKSRGRILIPYQEGLVPAFDLAPVLGLPGRPKGVIPHVVFEGEGRKLTAAAVDGLAGQFEAVIKPLTAPLDLLRGLSGVTLLPDGRPLFVLDLASLERSADSGATA